MKPAVLLSVVSITLALVLYSVAIWRSWRLKLLTPTNLVLLWLGVSADAFATRNMGLSIAGGIVWDYHTIAGFTGLGLMAVLAITGSWATLTNRESVLNRFYRYAIPVWCIWIASYLAGIVIGMQRA